MRNTRKNPYAKKIKNNIGADELFSFNADGSNN